MLHNPLIFGLGGVLAAAYFGAPKIFASRALSVRILFVAAIYAMAGIGAFALFDLKTAFVVAELGGVFTILGKLLAINFQMVHSPNYPKHRRCY